MSHFIHKYFRRTSFIMKLQDSTIYLAILKVVCCYPSSGENKPQRPSEKGSIDESQVAKKFPEVEYPTNILDTIHPFYYRAADHTDSLSPFTSEVKQSFSSLQAEPKVKTHSASQDSISSRDVDIPQTVEDSDDLLVNSPSSYNVLANTVEDSVCEGYLNATSEELTDDYDTNCQFNTDTEKIKPTSEEKMEMLPDDNNSQLNVNNEKVEPTSEEEMEILSDDTNYHFNVNSEDVEPTSEGKMDILSENTSSQFNVNKENVEPTSEEEVKISDGTNSQFNVDTENTEPTSIPTDSTDTSVTTLDD